MKNTTNEKEKEFAHKAYPSIIKDTLKFVPVSVVVPSCEHRNV